ncbi:28S ribosomal protein S36, mitochondrial [Thrips palmi]|uniref:28S ribosomal protein S36, mitochondrial n=1 Tax=Thrips palmi TaxID=161013 RepID=A0A6P8Z6N5_THRPL|nr:28S ribosomal protein S36, mitochondrial [Thrips palmi]
MSGVIKFFKSLVSSEPAATGLAAKASELSSRTASAESTPVHPTPSTPASAPSPPAHVQAVKPHVPLIKFRKGGPAGGHSATSGVASSGGVGSSHAVSRGTIEDYQLPARYQRSPLDEAEIDYINRGGPN